MTILKVSGLSLIAPVLPILAFVREKMGYNDDDSNRKYDQQDYNAEDHLAFLDNMDSVEMTSEQRHEYERLKSAAAQHDLSDVIRPGEFFHDDVDSKKNKKTVDTATATTAASSTSSGDAPPPVSRKFAAAASSSSDKQAAEALDDAISARKYSFFVANVSSCVEALPASVVQLIAMSSSPTPPTRMQTFSLLLSLVAVTAKAFQVCRSHVIASFLAKWSFIFCDVFVGAFIFATIFAPAPQTTFNLVGGLFGPALFDCSYIAWLFFAVKFFIFSGLSLVWFFVFVAEVAREVDRGNNNGGGVQWSKIATTTALFLFFWILAAVPVMVLLEVRLSWYVLLAFAQPIKPGTAMYRNTLPLIHAYLHTASSSRDARYSLPATVSWPETYARALSAMKQYISTENITRYSKCTDEERYNRFTMSRRDVEMRRTHQLPPPTSAERQLLVAHVGANASVKESNLAPGCIAKWQTTLLSESFCPVMPPEYEFSSNQQQQEEQEKQEETKKNNARFVYRDDCFSRARWLFLCSRAYMMFAHAKYLLTSFKPFETDRQIVATETQRMHAHYHRYSLHEIRERIVTFSPFKHNKISEFFEKFFGVKLYGNDQQQQQPLMTYDSAQMKLGDSKSFGWRLLEFLLTWMFGTEVAKGAHTVPYAGRSYDPLNDYGPFLLLFIFVLCAINSLVGLLYVPVYLLFYEFPGLESLRGILLVPATIFTVTSLLLSPSALRELITLAVAADMRREKLSRQNIMGAIDDYFSYSSAAVQRAAVPSEVIPEDCLEKHVLKFVTSRHVHLNALDTTEFAELEKMVNSGK